MMEAWSRRSSRSLMIVGAIAVSIAWATPSTARAEAIWSLYAYQNNIKAIGSIGPITNNTTFVAPFTYTLTQTIGLLHASYTATGIFSEVTTPGVGGSTASAFIDVTNLTITAAATNSLPITDVMWLFSDVFPNTAAGLPGYVGLSGGFVNPGVGSAQAELDFNNTLGNVSAFLRTPVVGASSPFGALVSAPIPVAVNELTGLLAFTLNPGQSLVLPFAFSDNFNIASVVPEPGSIVLLTLGIVPIGAMAVRRARRQRP